MIAMISEASSTSRNTSSVTPGMALLHYQPALGRIGVEVAEESVSTGLQRTDEHGNGGLRQYDLLAPEIRALEFFRGRVFVAHRDPESGASRNVQLAGNVLVIAQHQYVLGQVACPSGIPIKQRQGAAEWDDRSIKNRSH